ncbi:FliH/SctL family protein [bacterium]|jgi:flagellar assembly protein FliH|nr:FliH/SctL family protein [Rubripirellula sp.]MDC0317604.1 FliH/SctL family protein [bacterium]
MATVLKSGDREQQQAAAQNASAIAGFNLSDLADEGRSRLDQCRLQVQEMLMKAQQEVEGIHKAAEERGYQQGLDRAAVDAEKELQTKAEQQAKSSTLIMEQAVKQIREVHSQWMESYGEVLTQTALAAAEKIVQRRLEAEPELMVAWAKEALHSTRTALSLKVVVHPETLAQAGPAFETMVMAPSLPENTHIETDETMDRNEVVVRQDGGEIQAGLTAQLERLKELLQ